MTPKKQKISLKHILLHNDNWIKFYDIYKDIIRPGITIAIDKLLACKTTILGYKTLQCQNRNCQTKKIIPHTCKSKACSSCGRKATDTWIQKQMIKLPHTQWQHITFTLPKVFRDFFWCNRHLFQKITKIAADCLLMQAKKKDLHIGIFTALHSFGSQLNRNVHVHLSTTAQGLTNDGSQLKSIFFPKNALMSRWRAKILALFRTEFKKDTLIIPPKLHKELNHSYTFEDLLRKLARIDWIINCGKKQSSQKNNVEYLGRYIKRPPIAESRLSHYDGNIVRFQYLNRKTGLKEIKTLHPFEFIARFIRHIPDKGFRMIRYYGFLSNRLCGKILPKVFALLPSRPFLKLFKTSYFSLMSRSFGIHVMSCTVCKSPLSVIGRCFGKGYSGYSICLHQSVIQKAS